MRLLLLVLGTALMGFGIGYVVGFDVHKSNVITRAKSFGERETYSYKDMEVVIFGEIQD